MLGFIAQVRVGVEVKKPQFDGHADKSLWREGDAMGESMRGLSFEEARPLEERSAEVDGEILKIEARIAEAPAQGLVGVGVKLRLADFYRDPDLRDEAQYQACTRTALGTVERMLIAGKNAS